MTAEAHIDDDKVTQHSPKRRHPGSARLPTASFSIKSRNSSMRSGLISASTMTPKTSEVEERAVLDGGLDIFKNDGLLIRDETRYGQRRIVVMRDLIAWWV